MVRMPCGAAASHLLSLARSYNAMTKDGNVETLTLSRGADMVVYVENPDLVSRSKGLFNPKGLNTCVGTAGGIIKIITFTRAVTAAVNSALVSIFCL